MAGREPALKCDGLHSADVEVWRGSECGSAVTRCTSRQFSRDKTSVSSVTAELQGSHWRQKGERNPQLMSWAIFFNTHSLWDFSAPGDFQWVRNIQVAPEGGRSCTYVPISSLTTAIYKCINLTLNHAVITNPESISLNVVHDKIIPCDQLR